MRRVPCPIIIRLVEFALGVTPGLSHILALELLMDQYFANTVLKPLPGKPYNPIRLNRQFF